MTMGVNYIGPYYLSQLLMPQLRKAHSARIINVTSVVGINSSMHEEVLDFYDLKPGLYAYTASKFALVLYTIEQARRLYGSNITINALHPGIYGTNIWSGERPLIRYTQPFMKFFFPSPKKGAKAITNLATSPDLAKVTGALFMKTKKVAPKNGALDAKLRERLIEQTQNAVEEAIKCKKNIAI
jgi:NAD(P)-dependent dehydrogenase (short-subunit alcohol dehydrogenase family)